MFWAEPNGEGPAQTAAPGPYFSSCPYSPLSSFSRRYWPSRPSYFLPVTRK